MAKLLEIGDAWFIGTKIAIGAIAMFVLIKWGSFKIAEYGLAIALAVYVGLMGIHAFTGLAAFGLISASTLEYVDRLTEIAFAAII